MNFLIPAKTFLIGEYLALQGGPALVLTTYPCFRINLNDDASLLDGIHPNAPAARYWRSSPYNSYGLRWYDPFYGLGGMGASSAQFLGAYLVACSLEHRLPSTPELLSSYLSCVWNKKEGMRPSGYDVLAQSQQHCVSIDSSGSILGSHPWPFSDISFLLVHSGKKKETHVHLRSLQCPHSFSELHSVALVAVDSFSNKNSQQFITCVNQYHQILRDYQLVATSTLAILKSFSAEKDILAAKGCGALGADVILLIIPSEFLECKKEKLIKAGWVVLASEQDLYEGPILIEH